MFPFFGSCKIYPVGFPLPSLLSALGRSEYDSSEREASEAATEEICMCQVKMYSSLSTRMLLDEPYSMPLGLRIWETAQCALLFNGTVRPQ